MIQVINIYLSIYMEFFFNALNLFNIYNIHMHDFLVLFSEKQSWSAFDIVQGESLPKHHHIINSPIEIYYGPSLERLGLAVSNSFHGRFVRDCKISWKNCCPFLGNRHILLESMFMEAMDITNFMLSAILWTNVYVKFNFIELVINVSIFICLSTTNKNVIEIKNACSFDSNV